MDELGKRALPRFTLSIISKTMLFSFIGLSVTKGAVSVERAIIAIGLGFLTVCFFDIFVAFLPNYKKHLVLKNELGEVYEAELAAKLQETSFVRLFYSAWFLTRWKEHEANKLK